MSKLDYIGVRPCGCITAWMSGDGVTKADLRDFYRSMADSDREVRRASLDDIRDKPEFLNPDGCPHEEKVEATLA